MHLITYLVATAALFQQLDDDEAARGAHWLGDIADRHDAELAVEGWRQLSSLAPTHVATFQGRFAGRASNRHLGEVGTVLELVINVLSLAGSALDSVGTRAFRRRDQDVGQVELFGQLHLAHVGREEVLHFLLGDLDALGHATLTYTADDHLAAYLLACVVVRHSVTCQGSTELVDAHVISLGNGRDGLVQFLIGDANAGAFADLQLQVFDDQAFQHLLLQHAGRRRTGAALGDGLPHLVHARVQLALHDHVVVDDGHDLVQGLYLGMYHGTQKHCAQHQRAQTISKLDLHVDDNLECLGPGSSRPYCLPRHRGLSARFAGRSHGRLFRSAAHPG
ncbi:hypothetical protein D3C85_770450 [compost metagenome]